MGRGSKILIGVIAAAIVVFIAITIMIAISLRDQIQPGTGGTYFLAVVGACAAPLSPLLTFALLYTAQKQFGKLVDNSQAERGEAQTQQEMLRQQISQAQEVAEKQRVESAEALKLTRESNREVAKARLDQSAPRVSFLLLETEIVWAEAGFRVEHDDYNPEQVVPDVRTLEQDPSKSLFLIGNFEVRSWGAEPVLLHLGEPFNRGRGLYQVLDPGADNSKKYKIQWVIAASGNVRAHASQPESHESYRVAVTDVPQDIIDTFTWKGTIKLFHLDELGNVQLISGPLINCIPVAERKRHYVALDGPLESIMLTGQF